MQVTSAKALKILQALQISYPTEKLIVATSLPIELPGIRWCLLFPKQSACPSVMSIVNLLTRIYEGTQINQNMDQNSFFSPDEFFTGIINTAKKDGKAMACTFKNTPTVILSPKESAYYFAHEFEELFPLVAAPKSLINIKTFGDQQFEEEIKHMQFGARLNAYAQFDDELSLHDIGLKAVVKHNLDDLVWLSVFAASKGYPFDVYKVDDKIRMLETPSIFARDEFKNEYGTLAEIFLAKPTTIAEAGKIAGRSLFDTINFCNASVSLGNIEFCPA